jgi:hypothetical protein
MDRQIFSFQWGSDCCYMQMSTFPSMSWRNSLVHWMRWWWFPLCWIFMVLAHWKQSMGRHLAPLWHIILNARQPVFAFLLLSREAADTNYTVFDMTRLWLTIYHTEMIHTNLYTYNANFEISKVNFNIARSDCNYLPDY